MNDQQRPGRQPDLRFVVSGAVAIVSGVALATLFATAAAAIFSLSRVSYVVAFGIALGAWLTAELLNKHFGGAWLAAVREAVPFEHPDYYLRMLFLVTCSFLLVSAFLVDDGGVEMGQASLVPDSSAVYSDLIVPLNNTSSRAERMSALSLEYYYIPGYECEDGPESTLYFVIKDTVSLNASRNAHYTGRVERVDRGAGLAPQRTVSVRVDGHYHDDCEALRSGLSFAVDDLIPANSGLTLTIGIPQVLHAAETLASWKRRKDAIALARQKQGVLWLFGPQADAMKSGKGPLDRRWREVLDSARIVRDVALLKGERRRPWEFARSFLVIDVTTAKGAQLRSVLYKHGDGWGPLPRSVKLPSWGSDEHLELQEGFVLATTRSVNQPDDFGRIPLHWAVLSGTEEAVRELIARGSNVNRRDSAGNAPLHYARSGDGGRVTALLLSAGAHPNVQNHAGESPLMVRARAGSLGGVVALLAHGADPATRDKQGDTALHYAVRARHNDVVDVLIAARSPLNSQNNDGQTPLHLAAKGDVEAIHSLCIGGADERVRDAMGRTPLELGLNRIMARTRRGSSIDSIRAKLRLELENQLRWCEKTGVAGQRRPSARGAVVRPPIRRVQGPRQ